MLVRAVNDERVARLTMGGHALIDALARPVVAPVAAGAGAGWTLLSVLAATCTTREQLDNHRGDAPAPAGESDITFF